MAIVNVGNLTPQNFGAVGDGLVDDTAAIQLAINYIDSNNNEARLINFGDSSKIYRISSSLRIKSHQRLIGNGAVIVQNGISDVGFPIFDCSSCVNVYISGFKFTTEDKNYFNSPSSLHVAISCANSTAVTIRQNVFIDFTYSAVSSVGGKASDFLFENNTVVGPGPEILNSIDKRNNSGITIGGGKNILIANNTISNTSQGIYIIENSIDVKILRNTISDIVVEHGMYIDTGVSNLIIDNNIIRNIANTGIKIQNSNNDGQSSYISENIIVSNNIIKEIGESRFVDPGTSLGEGILIDNTSTVVTLFATTVNITNNSISDIGRNGINIRFSNNSIVSNNNIYNTKECGIYSDSNNFLQVSNNLINKTLFNGISVGGNGVDVFITDNVIKHSGLKKSSGENQLNVAILISGGEERTIKGNTVIGNFTSSTNPDLTGYTTYGILIESGNQSTMEMMGNSISKVKYMGIRLKTFPSEPLRYFANNISPYGVQNMPEEVKRGLADVYFGAGIPTSGYYIQGSIIFNDSPVLLASGKMGWMCVETGVPGIWKELPNLL